MRRSSDLNGVQKHQQNGLLEGDDNAGAEHLRSLAANDPVRELDVFGQIVAAFAGNSHREDVAVREGPRRRPESRSSPRLPIAGGFTRSASIEAG